MNRIGDDFRKVALLRPGSALTAEVEHPLRHFFNALGGPIDNFEIGAKRVIFRDAFLDKSEVSPDQHQGVGNLMREAGGELADRNKT